MQFGGTVELERAIRDLLLDWLGDRVPDDGFDQLLRTTNAGRDFVGELAAVLGPGFLADPLAAQQAFAASTVARGSQLTVTAGAAGGAGPGISLVLSQDGGGGVGPAGNTLPWSGLLAFGDTPVSSFAAVARPEAASFAVEATAAAAGTFDIGAVVPGANPGELVQLRFAGVALGAGGVARLVLDLAAGGPYRLQVDADGDGVADATRDPGTISVVDGRPAVVDVVVLQSSLFGSTGDVRDPATYGLLVGVLFDKPVTEASAESVANYTLADGNAVIGVQLQPSGRLAYLYLQRPIGGLKPRRLTLANVADAAGRTIETTTWTFAAGVSMECASSARCVRPAGLPCRRPSSASRRHRRSRSPSRRFARIRRAVSNWTTCPCRSGRWS